MASSSSNERTTTGSANESSAAVRSPMRLGRMKASSNSGHQEPSLSSQPDALPGNDTGDNHENTNSNDWMKTGASNSANVVGRRPRMNSRDIPRSYAGLYGNTDNLVPFELARKEHTDWIEQGGWLLLATYLGGIALIQVLAVLVLELLTSAAKDNVAVAAYILGIFQRIASESSAATVDGGTSDDSGGESSSLSSFALSWTIVHFIHCSVTLWYLHWCKGSPLYDVQNELAGLTLWEQLEGRPHNSVTKRTLTIIPTLICYAACHFGQYRRSICLINVGILWIIEVVAKLPAMNGVRILGINRTTGIDDYDAAGKSPTPIKSTKQL